MPALIPHEPTERLREDDMPQRREEEFRALALRNQQRAACKRASEPGVCTNCGSVCLPLAVYCDADCRDDHEARVKSAGRGG